MKDILDVIRAVFGPDLSQTLLALALGGRCLGAPSGPVAAGSTDAGRGGRLMIRPEPGVPGRARVIGSLTGDAIRVLSEAVDGGVRVLDLSEVDQADAAAVRILADLLRDRCTLVACPRWLELWLARLRPVTKEVS